MVVGHAFDCLVLRSGVWILASPFFVEPTMGPCVMFDFVKKIRVMLSVAASIWLWVKKGYPQKKPIGKRKNKPSHLWSPRVASF